MTALTKHQFLHLQEIPGRKNCAITSLIWCGATTVLPRGRLFSAGLDGRITEWDLSSLSPKVRHPYDIRNRTRVHMGICDTLGYHFALSLLMSSHDCQRFGPIGQRVVRIYHRMHELVPSGDS